MKSKVLPSQWALHGHLSSRRNGSLVSKLTLDINTTPSSNAFAVASVPDLYNEFVVLAREIATQGDIP